MVAIARISRLLDDRRESFSHGLSCQQHATSRTSASAVTTRAVCSALAVTSRVESSASDAPQLTQPPCAAAAGQHRPCSIDVSNASALHRREGSSPPQCRTARPARTWCPRATLGRSDAAGRQLRTMSSQVTRRSIQLEVVISSMAQPCFALETAAQPISIRSTHCGGMHSCT